MWIYIRQDIAIPDYLCFTANTASSTVQLTKNGSPTSVTLETSTDWLNWTTYTMGDTITLSNIWDKVYRRNTSETDTGFSLGYNSNYYQFVTSWSLACSWDVNYLLNKNSTTTVSNYCYWSLFSGCSITTAPKLLATTLWWHCYRLMFYWCTDLEALPSLPATSILWYSYYAMFSWCSKIKLSSTQTWDYQTEYRIPTTWTGTAGSYALQYMFTNTWGTYTGNAQINTTYYTSNTVI